MGKRLTRFGYCEAQALQPTLLAAEGDVLRGHEFHYSIFLPKRLLCWHVAKSVTVRRCKRGPAAGESAIPLPAICTFTLLSVH